MSEREPEPIVGEWIGGIGRLRYYRVTVRAAAGLAVGGRFMGGEIRRLTVRGSTSRRAVPWVEVRVRYADRCPTCDARARVFSDHCPDPWHYGAA